jgi:hypothetical protein
VHKKILAGVIGASIIGAALFYVLISGSRKAGGADASNEQYVQLVESVAASKPPSSETAAQSAAMEDDVRSEPRDAVWADSRERSIRNAVGRLPFMDMAGQVRVLCATTICEVSVVAPDTLGPEHMRQFWALLQSSVVLGPLAKEGLKFRSASIGRNGDPHAILLYFDRRS